jgi:hypothetical protein
MQHALGHRLQLDRGRPKAIQLRGDDRTADAHLETRRPLRSLLCCRSFELPAWGPSEPGYEQHVPRASASERLASPTWTIGNQQEPATYRRKQIVILATGRLRHLDGAHLPSRPVRILRQYYFLQPRMPQRQDWLRERVPQHHHRSSSAIALSASRASTESSTPTRLEMPVSVELRDHHAENMSR